MERLGFDVGLLDLPVVCPAGVRVEETIEGPACECRIEGSIITAAKDPSSLAGYCMGVHELCPTWREARHLEHANGDPMRMIDAGGAARTYGMDDLEEIQAREDAGDFASADAMRRAIMERKHERGLPPGFGA